MAVNVDHTKMPDDGNGGDRKKETKYIKAGMRLARLVSYVELGKHHQMFKGQRAKFEQGKKAGTFKPPVFHVALTFEFPGEAYTGDYPLTISTTRKMKNGDFFDAVTLSDALMDGSLSKGYAMKTKFMKFLTRMQAATGKTYTNLAQFAKEQSGVMISVTNQKGQAREDGTIPVYANMKPEGIQPPSLENPVSGKVEVFDVPAAKGEYCAAFEWDAPTKETWEALPSWHKETVKKALDFEGSPIHTLLVSNPDLDKAMDDKAEDHSTPEEPANNNTNQAPPV